MGVRILNFDRLSHVYFNIILFLYCDVAQEFVINLNIQVLRLITVRRLQWCGHIVRMDGERIEKITVEQRTRKKGEKRKIQIKVEGWC